MDRRLSILIKEIKKSSRNSGSSILSLINLDKKDKKPVSEKATSNIVNIADAKPKILDNSYEKRKPEVKNESVALDTETKSITPSVEKEVVIEKHITQVEKEIPKEHVLENKVEKEDIEDMLEDYPNLLDMSVEELETLSRKKYWEADGMYQTVCHMESQAELMQVLANAKKELV